MATHAYRTRTPTVQPSLLRAVGPCCYLTEAEVLNLVGEVSPLLSLPETGERNCEAILTIGPHEGMAAATIPSEVSAEGIRMTRMPFELPEFGEIKSGDTTLPPPAPLPSLPAAFSRRRAIFGAVAFAAARVAVLPAMASAIVPLQADARLVALADELRAGAAALLTLANSDPRDCHEIPGYPAAENRLSAIVAELQEVRAESMVGIVAVARALQVPFMSEDYQITGDLAWNLADDLVRLFGGQAHV